MDFNSGGKQAIERLVQAYGFTTRQALSDHLGVSKSTLATRYMRDIFPADWVIQCALETGTSLKWLVTGMGDFEHNLAHDLTQLPCKKIISGKLMDASFLMFDKALLAQSLKDPFVLIDSANNFIVDKIYDDVTDGTWLVEIEGKVSIRDLTRIPVGKVKVVGNGADFECSLSEIKIIAKCISLYRHV